MKRKILILLCVVCLVLSFSVTALASNITLPELPRGTEKYWIVATYGSSYRAYNYTEIPTERNETSIIIGSVVYDLMDGVWTEYESGTNYLTKTNIVYDSLGNYASNSLKIFGVIVPIEFEDFNAYYDGLKGQITVQNVVGVLVVGVGAVIGIVFMYWGIRKGVKALMSAFKKGKISL